MGPDTGKGENDGRSDEEEVLTMICEDFRDFRIVAEYSQNAYFAKSLIFFASQRLRGKKKPR